MATFGDFQKLDIRVGEIVKAQKLEDGRYSTHKLTINLGEKIGEKTSCARLIQYTLDELKGKRVLCVVNFPPKQIGKTISEVLTLGVPDEKNECVLVSADKKTPLGGRLF